MLEDMVGLSKLSATGFVRILELDMSYALWRRDRRVAALRYPSAFKNCMPSSSSNALPCRSPNGLSGSSAPSSPSCSSP